MFKKFKKGGIIVSLVLLGLGGGVLAATDETELTQEITQGSLEITAPDTATFSSVTFSFTSQSSADNALGTINASDTRGSFAGWKIDVTGEDWSDGTHTMDYDGDGSSTGQLSLDIPVAGDVTVNSGANDVADWTFGTDDAFDSSTDTINLVTVPTDKGSGDYDITNTKATQFIPAQQSAGSYNMTLTYTIY